MHVDYNKGVRMTIYAVMKSGGKEYRVAPGEVVRVEKLAAAPGATVQIHEVLSIGTERGVTVGSPTVVDARVIADVIEEGHGEKILIFKKKRRDHYQMMTGELQSYSTLRIREIAVGENVYALAALPSKAAPAAMPPALVSAELVATQPAAAEPTCDTTHPVQPVESPPAVPSITETPPARFAPPALVETAAPAPVFAERAAGKRNHGIAALVAGLLVIAAGLLVWGSREPQAAGEAAVEVATAAAPSQVAQPSVPAPARKELAVKKTAAASAPSAPVQPPE
jgi:large subunit ribosomal protein L21